MTNKKTPAALGGAYRVKDRITSGGTNADDTPQNLALQYLRHHFPRPGGQVNAV
jgi:hypothetical protein